MKTNLYETTKDEMEVIDACSLLFKAFSKKRNLDSDDLQKIYEVLDSFYRVEIKTTQVRK